jgi:dTMP kinase
LAKKTGLFVTLEGPDGSGKSTQAGLLAAALRKLGQAVVQTRQPGGSALAAPIRAVLLDPAMRGLDPAAELLLFAADRRQHVADTILPALAQGKVVLCDRYTDSTRAYQGAGRALKAADVAWLNRFASHGLAPKLTLLYDIPVGEGLNRAKRHKGGLDRMEQSSRNYFERVRRGFLAIAKAEPRRVKRLAVAGRSPEAIAAEGLQHLLKALKQR